MQQPSTFKDFSGNRRKILKIKKKLYLSVLEPTLYQSCLRNPRIACKADHAPIPMEDEKNR
jgi:hypothetical protein